MAARRADRDRARERPANDRDNGGDNRWTTVEDKDTRHKRANNRDRKSARDESRERDKEKEPAWMETYVPSPSAAGILGGKTIDGEMDSIQAWKKGMKEKEQKEHTDREKVKPAKDPQPGNDTAGVLTSGSNDPVDEIQLFKMLMKKEQEHKPADGSSPNSQSDDSKHPKSVCVLIPDPSYYTAKKSESEVFVQAPKDSSQSEPPNSLLSLLSSNSAIVEVSQATTTMDTHDNTRGAPLSSRLFPRPVSQQGGNLDKAVDDQRPFNPSQTSRVLGLGTDRSADTRNNATPLVSSVSRTPNSGTPPLHASSANAFDRQRPQPNFSPFDDQSRSQFSDHHGLVETELHRTISEVGSIGHAIDETNGGVSPGGSRFAKFFDGKPRATQPARTSQLHYSGSPQDSRPTNSMAESHQNNQNTMDDIFNMLHNSSQVRLLLLKSGDLLMLYRIRDNIIRFLTSRMVACPKITVTTSQCLNSKYENNC
jgi:zinc finger CCCH domain-containing protein 13